MSSKTLKKRVCIIGCGPSGLSALYHFGKLSDENIPEIVCYEKQSTWGGLWNRTWRTGTDEYGEHLHSSMYNDLWTNDPKEVFEYDDYTYEQHFGKLIPGHVTVPVIRDYLEGRFSSGSKRDLREYVRFSTVVTRVDYNKESDNFTVRAKDLSADKETEETFTHVIVASGTFNYPVVPEVAGLDQFKGRVLHSKDVKHMNEFEGKRLLLIGARWSAEDLAIQALKYGAENIIISYRTQPHGQDWFEFPKGISQHPQVDKIENNIAYFKDGTCAEVDIIIFCTGYRWHFPFLADDLRVKEQFFISKDFYKSTLWLKGGNGKLLYIGAHYTIYSFPVFEAQAVWACRYITGDLIVPTRDEMIADTDKWLNKMSKIKLTDILAVIRFFTECLDDLCEASGYTKECTKAEAIFQDWYRYKQEDILTYRDHPCKSVYTGKMTPKHHTPWMRAFDDSLKAFNITAHMNK